MRSPPQGGAAPSASRSMAGSPSSSYNGVRRDPSVQSLRRSRTPDGTSPRSISTSNNAPIASLDQQPNSGRRIENGSVRVVVRSRPLNAVEKARGDQHLFRFSAKEPRDMQVISAATGAGNRELVRSFQFDFCASEELSQTSFFRSSGAMALMDSVADGYLATIFAYGQTGSGKTYSMSGIEELLAVAHKKALESAAQSPQRLSLGSDRVELSDGIIPRALKYLFTLFEKAPKEVKFVVRASYCEIYNEQVFDLLNPASGSLSVRWNDRSGFYVQNLLMVQCDSIDDIMAVVQEGHKNRRVGTHEMNKDSSRSHSIMTVHVDRQTTDPNDGHVISRFGKVSFVDLAGSERLKETKSSNTEETSNINKSLLTLGKVISALASKANVNFIPYRDSKLTKLLMDSLGGNSLTLMVACISPSSAALEDTLSTLNYATRAKNIQNKPTVQVDPIESALSNLRKENHQLRAENEALRMRLCSLGANGLRASQSRLPLLDGDESPRHHNRQQMNRNPSLASIPSTSRLQPLSESTSHLVLPPIGVLRSPGKERREQGLIPTKPSMPPASSVNMDAYKNQLVSLQEENESLMQHSTAADLKVRQLKTENEKLLQQLRQAAPDVSASGKVSPTKSARHGAVGNQSTSSSAVDQLKLQVQQLQQREQELMQALVLCADEKKAGKKLKKDWRFGQLAPEVDQVSVQIKGKRAQMAEEVVKAKWLQNLDGWRNLVDDDDSSDSSASSSDDGNGPPSAATGTVAITVTKSLAVAETSSVPLPPQRRSNRVPLPSAKKKAAVEAVTPTKKSTTKKKTVVKAKVVSDVESGSDSSGSGSDGDDDEEEEVRGRATKKKLTQKKSRTSSNSSPKMSRATSSSLQRDRSTRATKKKSTVTKAEASADAKAHVKKAQSAKERRKTEPTKKEHAVAKKVKPVTTSDSSGSGSDTGSDSDGSDDSSKRKRSEKHSEAERAASAIAMARKREVAAKERADRLAPKRISPVVPSEAPTKESAEQSAQRVVRLRRIPSDASIKPEYKAAGSRSSSVSRKRPLPSPKVCTDVHEAVEKKSSSADREYMPTTPKERKDQKPSTKENGEPVLNSSSKASAASKREAYKKKQLSQEEQDWKLALMLSSRKSDRSRRRTGSEDTIDSVKREPPADDRSNKRKRVGSSATSPIVTELPKTDDHNPPSRVRKTSVDAGSKRVDTPKASEKLNSPKKARMDHEEKTAGVVSRAKSHPEEKPTPPQKKTRTISQDNDVSSQEAGELKTKRSAAPKSEKERDEASKKRRDRKPVSALAFEGITEVVKPTRLLLGSKLRPDGDAVVGKKLMLGPSTPSRKEKERDELQLKKRREGKNSSGVEFEGLPRKKTESEDRHDADQPMSKKSVNGSISVAELTKTNDTVKSESVCETHSENDPASSDNKSKTPVPAGDATATEETKREPAAYETQESSTDSGSQKPTAVELPEAKAESVKKVSAENDGDIEEGEEDEEEGAAVDEIVAPSANGDVSKQDANTAAKEEKSENGIMTKPAADPVDLISFVIPKKKIRRTDDSSSARAPVSSSLPPVINASIRRTPASSPLPRELEAGKGKSGNSRADREERVIPRRRRRTKNPVPVAIPALSRQEKEFMHLARKVNSLVEAAHKPHAVAEGSKSSSRAGPYDVLDSSGNVIPDFIPRMKCPTKKQMKTQTDQFPTPFFGVSMSLPGKMEPAEDSSAEEKPEGSSNQSEALQSEINVYEQLVFERREDREAYLKKMYGTTFVPQLLRGLTSLIMRNVRYERKSTGFQFNTERDREEFAKSLSERYTMNKSVPRCEIPPKNWQQLMNKMPAVVYLHYMNKEDGELAAQRFFDDNGVPLERKRTNRVGGTISAGNSPAPQATPRRSRSNERSAPESSPAVARKENLPRDSSQGARNWQPYHDEQRPSDRREDRNGSSSSRGSREWPPRVGDLRNDRRLDRVEEPRGERRSDQRYELGDGARDGSQRSRRRRGDRNRSRTRSGSRSRANGSQPQSQSMREYDDSYWPSDSGRRGDDDEQPDFHDSQAANSAEELSDSQGKSMVRSSSQGGSSRPYSKVEDGEEHQRLEHRRDADGHQDRARSEGLGKENSDSKRQHINQDDVQMEEDTISREQEQLERGDERSRSPEQDRPDGVRDGDTDDRAPGRGFDVDRRHHRGEEFERSRSRDDSYYLRHHNGYDNDNQNIDRVPHNGEYEFADRDRHPRRHPRSRSRSHPRQPPPPHLNHNPDRLDRDREHTAHHDREYSHSRDGGRFSGEFDDRNGRYDYPHSHHERDRAFQRHGGRGGDEYARHQRHHHPY